MDGILIGHGRAYGTGTGKDYKPGGKLNQAWKEANIWGNQEDQK